MSVNPYNFLAALVSIISAAVIVLITRYLDISVFYYVATLSLSTVLIFILLRKSSELNPTLFWIITIAIHGIAIFGVALYEDDYFRFIWDGWQTLQGTPYGKPPAGFYTDPNVPGHLWPILDNVNNPNIPTIYGPTLQFIFAAIYAISDIDPIGLRITLSIFNIMLIIILTRQSPLHQVALYAWCPLVVTELIIHIHPDGIMAMFLAAGLWLSRKHPILAGIFWGLAAGVKIIALAAWPLMLRWPKKALLAAIVILISLYGYFAAIGPSLGFDSTRTFANEWLFNPMGFDLLLIFLPQNIARLSAAFIGITIIILIHARTRDRDFPPLAAIFGIILFLAPAVNSWYMIWILPFATKSRQIWPFVAASFIPLSYVTGLTLDTDTLREFEVHPAAWSIEIIAIISALIYDFIQSKRFITPEAIKVTPIESAKIGVVIPALNEQGSVGGVVASLRILNATIIVADNGSTDETVEYAIAAGAKVVNEPQKGYGSACLAGIAALPDDVNIILFIDADGSDTPNEANNLLQPIIEGHADMVIGSRALGRIEKGAMTLPQRFGNWLSTRLVHLIWQQQITDLGPFRAIRRDALDKLKMADRDFGWTIEMQVKAIQQHMRVLERPANYRKRIGISKISGTISGVWGAGTKILYIIGREAFFR